MQPANAAVVLVDDDFIDYQRAMRASHARRDELFEYAVRFPGTAMGVRAQLLLDVPNVTEVTVTMTSPSSADIALELPAWVWLTLGIMHLLTWRRARRVLRRAAPTRCATRITMGVRRIARPAQLAGAAARSTTRVA